MALLEIWTLLLMARLLHLLLLPLLLRMQGLLHKRPPDGRGAPGGAGPGHKAMVGEATAKHWEGATGGRGHRAAGSKRTTISAGPDAERREAAEGAEAVAAGSKWMETRDASSVVPTEAAAAAAAAATAAAAAAAKAAKGAGGPLKAKGEDER